tara:strand:- start:245 stop:706 length:462 start_codon:yes stop_codon:yes gene_type:complete
MLVNFLESPPGAELLLVDIKNRDLVALAGTCKSLRSLLQHAVLMRALFHAEFFEIHAKVLRVHDRSLMYVKGAPGQTLAQAEVIEAEVLTLARDLMRRVERMTDRYRRHKVPFTSRAMSQRQCEQFDRAEAKFETYFTYIVRKTALRKARGYV